MIGIIGAMAEEVLEIKKLMVMNQQKEYQGYIFYEGTLNNKGIVLLQGGIGKVNAAIATTLLFTHYSIDYVINIGSAGGLHSHQNVGDVVISSQVVHHDVDVTAFGRALGEVIASGNQFISNSQQVKTIQKHFPEAMCVEMEAAAIAQVCHVYHKKFIITRSLSDVFNKGKSHIQFDEYLKEASLQSAQMCNELVSQL